MSVISDHAAVVNSTLDSIQASLKNLIAAGGGTSVEDRALLTTISNRLGDLLVEINAAGGSPTVPPVTPPPAQLEAAKKVVAAAQAKK